METLCRFDNHQLIGGAKVDWESETAILLVLITLHPGDDVVDDDDGDVDGDGDGDEYGDDRHLPWWGEADAAEASSC